MIQLSKCFLQPTTSIQKGGIWKEGTCMSDVIIIVYSGRCYVYKPQLGGDNRDSLVQFNRFKVRGDEANRPLEALQNFPALAYTQATGKKMKPSDYDEDVHMLTKTSVKILLVRNTMNQAKLTKEARQLEKERHSEEMLFLKKREYLIKQQTARNSEIGQTPLSSRNSLQPESAVTRWKSETSLAGELSPKSRRKSTFGDYKKQSVLSSSFPLLSVGNAQQPSPQSRRKAPTVTVSSLPDIHASTNKTTGRKKNTDTNKTSKVSYKKTSGASLDSKTGVSKDWKELEKCRYLRTKES